MTAYTYCTMRLRAFSARGVQMCDLKVSNSTVQVYDDISGNYTTCHALSARTVARIIKKVRESV